MIFGTGAYRELWDMACNSPDPSPKHPNGVGEGGRASPEEGSEGAGDSDSEAGAEGAEGNPEDGEAAGDSEDDADAAAVQPL